MKTTDRFYSLAIWLMFAAVLCGCAPSATPDTTPLRVALLPIIDALPVYTAQDGGFFAGQNLQVEFVFASSAAERDQLLAAGQADATINDLLAVALFNRASTQLQVVRFAHLSTAGAPLYVIAAAPNSSIRIPPDLAGVEIGISQGSIIDYVTHRMLTAGGVDEGQVKTVAVPRIPDRMALLLSGQIQAATLPQPFATIAVQQGARPIVDDTFVPGLGNSVLSFRKEFIDAHPQVVRAFILALNQATAALHDDPEAYRGLLGKYKVLSPDILQTFILPKFPGDSLPSAAQFEDVVDFALRNKLLGAPVKYSDAVNDSFLSK